MRVGNSATRDEKIVGIARIGGAGAAEDAKVERAEAGAEAGAGAKGKEN